MVNGVEHCAAVVAQHLGVGGLDEGAIVVHEAFDEVGHCRGLGLGGRGWQGELGCGGGFEHVVLKRVRWEVLKGGEEVSNVPASLCCGAEIGRAGGPAHLEGCRDDNEWFGIRVGRIRGQNITELFLVGIRDNHPPEAILDVELGKEDGTIGVREGAHLINEALDDIAQFVHGVGGGNVLVGEFVD